MAATKPIEWQQDSEPFTLLGDPSWKNYTVRVDAELTKPGMIELIGQLRICLQVHAAGQHKVHSGVEVDPRRVLLLDVNRTNNSAALDPEGPRAARKWSLTWLVWLQDQLLTYGFFV